MATTTTHRRNTTHQHTPTQNGRTGSRTGSGADGGANSGTDGGLGADLVLDEAAAVRFLPSGLPLALRWRGGLWQVIGTPTSWSTPNNRPGFVSAPTPLPMPGSSAGTRFWRFQAQTGPASPVLEFEMSADPRSTDWQLRRVTTVDGF
ncbi:hypothetical protein [Arthrobacter antioxidans]|uniref:hypothetical protein n=1 Tax=Arthrobacter antioxidans TaxID=2895818 RepID=UPI0020004B47|nr:hypothetical protein [Arthrobacter antioxidans]